MKGVDFMKIVIQLMPNGSEVRCNCVEDSRRYQRRRAKQIRALHRLGFYYLPVLTIIIDDGIVTSVRYGDNNRVAHMDSYGFIRMNKMLNAFAVYPRINNGEYMRYCMDNPEGGEHV